MVAGLDGNVEIRRRIAGARGQAEIAPAPGAPGGAHHVRCLGTVDDSLFHDIYAAIAGTARNGRLALIVDIRDAEVAVGYDGYAATAATLRRHGIATVAAVVCDSDPARTLDAKLAREVAQIGGLTVLQRVTARPQDCGPALSAMLRERPA